MVLIKSNTLELRYTGHPFIDVGVATIMAWVKVREPHQVTYEHLEKVAEELREIYVYLKPVRNFISTIFLNSHFVQPAKSEEERWQYANEVLFAFREDRPILEGVNCTFFPELPAVMYAHRQYIPLLNGQDISNFSGLGTIGIPISGIALLAIHAMPLGCMKCGHLMAFHQLRAPHEDSRDMTLALAKLAFDANKPAIQMMFQDSDRSLPSFGSYQKTRYVDALLKAEQKAQQANLRNITGYYFTNYGPSPNLEIVRLDNAVMDFVDTARQDAGRAWNRVVGAGWQRPKGEEKTEINDETTQTWRNNVYEALFELPLNSSKFVRLLRKGNEWYLVEIFLKKVLGMDEKQINLYKSLGERLSDYMDKYHKGSWSFYHEFKKASYWKVRQLLRSANERCSRDGLTHPLITSDDFIVAFENPYMATVNFSLARDIITMCMFDKLHNLGWTLKGTSFEEQLEDESDQDNEEEKE